MDLGKTDTTTEVQTLTSMVQYYRYMWTRRSHVLNLLIEADRGTKGGKILQNDELEESFEELNRHNIYQIRVIFAKLSSI